MIVKQSLWIFCSSGRYKEKVSDKFYGEGYIILEVITMKKSVTNVRRKVFE